MQRTLEAIADHPAGYPAIHRDTRRGLVRRFPYAVFYRVVGEQVVVVACMHARRNPNRWRGRRNG